MKRITKAALVTALILCMFGLVLGIAGVAVGINYQELQKGLQGESGWFDEHWNFDEADYVSEKSSFAKEKVSGLELDISSGYVKIEESKDDEIHVLSDRKDDRIYFNEAEKKLSVVREKFRNHGKDESPITIEVPADHTFQTVEVNLLAGKIDVGNVNADSLKISVNAGQIKGSGKMVAENAELFADAGQITLKYLDAKSIEAACNAGQIKMTLAGSEKEYEAKLSCDLGNISYGKENYKAGRKSIRSEGTFRYMELSCDLGNINVEFEK